MKQRISVRAIIRRKDTTLLVRRSGGSEKKQGLHELPGGSLGSQEQPEDGLRRHLADKLGVSNASMRLHEVVVTTDDWKPDVVTLSIAYLVSVSGEKIDLGDAYARYVWADANKLQQLDITSATRGLLDKVNIFTTDFNVENPHIIKNTTHGDKVIIYADGGSRGNPGHSAAGFVIFGEDGKVLYEGGEYLGITTNNQAEYHGVRLGLEKARELGFKYVDFRLDSMLVVNQMKGVYQIKNRDLWPINERIQGLVAGFDKVTFSHVRREFNKHADSLVNKVLDEHKRKDS